MGRAWDVYLPYAQSVVRLPLLRQLPASAETYGADRLWVVLKPIPIELDSEDEEIDAEVQRRGEASRRCGEGAGPSGSQPMEMGELSHEDED